MNRSDAIVSDFGRYEPTRWDFVCCLLRNREFWSAVACYALVFVALPLMLWVAA